MMEDESSECRNHARLGIMELANMISVPMSLNAVVRLKVADAIWDGGSNTPLSASQILTRLLPSGGGDPENLQRILRMLSSYGVFTEHLNGSKRNYSLTDVGKTLVTDSEGLSYAPYVLQHHQDALMRAWPLVHDAVLDPSTEPFVKANGEPAYGYYGKKPEMNGLMQKAMSGVSVPFMKAILEGYNGFEGVERLVDVGGSGGDCLRMILLKHPNVRQGINFDLPEVVAKAPQIPGVTHVGGDMFKSIPRGDAIFMKWVLTTWTDDECKLIMQNCNKALPEGGKLIACEPVLPKETDDSHRTRALLEGDIFVMTVYRAKGKHRTEEEFRRLGLSSGFPNFRAVYIDYFYTVLEFQK
ncbi:nicotinate N-methyltransferase 1 [Ziziphus jujuba]|uniref:Nicotinate N-methyltransferase 1 n=1 Tax=Ziziphus jujuba TaxID=326968 RepID=A0A6P4AL13_ZIZJJ|nr:nicotinate N-methyltransferase 1 [Ziziphus jujuba]